MTRIHSVAGVAARRARRSSPCRRFARRITARRRRRSSAAARARARARSPSRIAASSSWTSCRSSRARCSSRCGSRSRTACVAVARVGGHALFPARFQLVGTMNMCPCGARGDPALECACSPQRLAAYREKLSRALLDRFDLAVAMPRPRAAELAAPRAEASAAVRERVRDARERLRASPPRRTDAASELLSSAVDRLPLSGRGRARVARVARTIAALAERGRRSSPRTSPRRSRTACPESCPRRDARSGASAVATRPFRALLAAIHDPPPQLYLRGSAEPRPARPACGRRRRSARVLVVRPLGRALARARPGRGGARRRERDGTRHRRRGAPRSARGRRDDRRRARLRHRSRLPGRARRARAPDRASTGSSCPSTSRASSLRRGGSRRGTGSSPASARRPSWSRLASEAAR